MHPTTSFRSARLALIAFFILPCSLCLAQDKDAGDVTRPAQTDPHVISIDFQGGPLSKLVAQMTTKEGPMLSLIQAEGLDPVLPAFSVRNARVDAVMAAVGRLLDPQGFALIPVAPNLAVLSKIERHRGRAFASFQLEGKIGVRPVEEVIAAIQAGCEFANPEEKPSTLRFKYHPGTKLLFVAGTEQEVDVAHRVFGSLPESPPKELPQDKK